MVGQYARAVFRIADRLGHARASVDTAAVFILLEGAGAAVSAAAGEDIICEMQRVIFGAAREAELCARRLECAECCRMYRYVIADHSEPACGDGAVRSRVEVDELVVCAAVVNTVIHEREGRCRRVVISENAVDRVFSITDAVRTCRRVRDLIGRKR